MFELDGGIHFFLLFCRVVGGQSERLRELSTFRLDEIGHSDKRVGCIDHDHGSRANGCSIVVRGDRQTSTTELQLKTFLAFFALCQVEVTSNQEGKLIGLHESLEDARRELVHSVQSFGRVGRFVFVGHVED